ncbi:MAG: cation transporter, partial [Thermoanaerobaculia bacterium]
AGLATSVVAAFGASICCIGPIASAFLGLTSFGALVKYEKFRPLFIGVTLFANANSACCPMAQHSSPVAASASEKVTTLHIEGMTCGACATAVKQVLKKVDGVTGARVSYEEKSALVTYDAAKVTPEKIARAITERLPTYKATVVK